MRLTLAYSRDWRQSSIKQNIRAVIYCTENELGHLTFRFGGNLN